MDGIVTTSDLHYLYMMTKPGKQQGITFIQQVCWLAMRMMAKSICMIFGL